MSIRILLNKYHLIILGIALTFFSGSLIYSLVRAEADDITYPVLELGNCQDESACRKYCDNPDRMDVCLTFAEKHNLISAEEAERARRFGDIEGPGGCVGRECETYCEDVAHIDECLDFAEEHEIIPEDELEEARKVAQALKAGANLPGNCTSKKNCEVYCEDTAHIDECLAFAEQAGFLPPEELAEARKFQAAVKSGVTPPKCRGKEACDQYCAAPENMTECMDFALKAGFIPEEEREEVEKAFQAIKAGAVPPKCRGKNECEAYCAEPEHSEECLAFAEKAGFISGEEAAMARKFGMGGPGGCKSKEKCESFCNDPANQETCFSFAKERGMIPEEDLERMKEGVKQMKEGFSQAPPEVKTCLENKLGTDITSRVESGSFMPNPQMGDVMRECFEQSMPQSFGPEGMEEGGARPEGMMPPAGQFQGPGGCRTPEECEGFCRENPDQCGGSGPAGGEGFQEGMMPPPEGIPREEFERQSQEQFQQEFQQQFQEQSQQQFQQEFQRQLQEQTPPGMTPQGEMTPGTNMMPPEGMITPPTMMPPTESMPPATMMPSPEMMSPPPPMTSPPPSSFNANTLFGAILHYFFGVK